MSSPPEHLLSAARACPRPGQVLTRLERLAKAGAELAAPDLAQILVPVLCNSGFLANWLVRHPQATRWLSQSAALFAPLTADTLQRWYTAALTQARSELPDPVAAVMRALRQMKFHAFLQITARDVALHRPIHETCAELSLVAEVACELALSFARAQIDARHGPASTPEGAPIPFVILGMGKLGGYELNYSSDIDLIYFYGQDEGDAGEQTVHQHFKRVSELLTRLLGEPTEDGFVFRVDLRLRPEGRSGPLCNSLSSAESYYESWGRLWERMAWLRARPIAGDLDLGAELLHRLSPWIYRRTLDYSLLNQINALKGEILKQRQAVKTLGLSRGVDLKLDPGGIRAVEFSANALQLIHAGRQPELRDASTLGALERLWAAGHLTAEEHDALAAAYLLFRRVEHRIQMEEERQTHRLPTGEALAALAERLGYRGEDPGAALVAELNAHRGPAGQIFEGILGQQRAPGMEDVDDEATARARLLLSAGVDQALQREVFSQAGFADPAQAVHLLAIAGRRPQSPLSPRASDQRARLGRHLLSALLLSAEPERALTHLTALLTTLGPHGFYLNLLEAHPRVGRMLVEILAASDFVGEAVARQPGLLERLIDAHPARELGARLAAKLDEGPGRADPELRLEHLARARQSLLISIGLGDLGGVLDDEDVERALTELAEGVLQEALALAWQMMRPRYGQPAEGAGWCVVALGKLGGGELSYGSDLDLVFLYEAPGETDGPKPLSHQEWFTRLTKRTISLLSMPTSVGPLYEVDTRLRPGGTHGTLVARLARFRDHHQGRAGTWERMALVRGRAIAGTPAFRAQVTEALTDLTYHRPPSADLYSEMARLRRRMEVEIARETPERYNPKVGRGGLVDLEFMVQALQITHGGAHPDLRTPNTRAALDALGQRALLPDAEGLIAAHRFLRRLEHRMRVVKARSNPELRTHPVSLDRLARRLGYRRDPLAPQGTSPGAALLSDYKTTVDFVRRRFDQLFCPEEILNGDR